MLKLSKPWRLIFRGCSLGNTAADMLLTVKRLCFLGKIVLSSDPIGNQGIKRLMKLEIPYLQTFHLHNTNITSDSMKILRHKKWPHYKLDIGIMMQTFFNYGMLFK